MTLNQYLERRKESQAAFGRRAGIPQKTVNNICTGGSCTAATADLIIKASQAKPTTGGGTVRLEDLT